MHGTDAAARWTAALAAVAAALLAAAPARADVKLLVKFDRGVTARTQAAVLDRADAEKQRTLPKLGVQVVTVDAGDAAAALRMLNAAAPVDYAERDAPVRAAMALPEDPNVAVAPWTLLRPDFPTAWDVTTGSAVVVAVVDTGVNVTADLSGAVLPGYDFFAGDADASDEHGHGTVVASEIAARAGNGVGGAGVCWACRILPVRVLGPTGSGTTDGVADGIRWAADHGAKVINLSLGSTTATQTEADAVAYAQGRGVLVVAAAGNNHTSAPFYPAADPGVLSVGASDPNDARYDFSNYGSWVKVAAPGFAYAPVLGGGYGGWQGTSMASPYVAGLAALGLSVKPGASAAELSDAILQGADPIGSWVVAGRIDAAKTLRALGASLPAHGPVALVAPQLSGAAAVGQRLSVSVGTWSTPLISTTFRWERCDSADTTTCAAIAGATAAAYAVPLGDAGHRLRAVVTARDSAGTTQAATAPRRSCRPSRRRSRPYGRRSRAARSPGRRSSDARAAGAARPR